MTSAPPAIATPVAVESLVGGRRAILAGQRVRIRLLRRRLAAEAARDRGRALGLVAFGLGFGLLIFGVAVVGGVVAVRKGAPELVMTGTVAGLYAVMAALVLSSVGHAAQAFFVSKDLWMWDSAPTGSWARFVDRFTETGQAALPPTLAMGSIALAGLQVGGGGGAGAALRAIVAVLLVAPVPVAVGVVVAHLMGAVLPAGRLRRLSLVFVGCVVTAGLVWFRQLRVERLLSEAGANEVLSRARDLGPIGPELLPPPQLAAFVVDGDLLGLLRGGGMVALAIAIAFGAHVAFYDRARKLAVDESPTGVIEGSLTSRMLRLVVLPVPTDIRPLVRKDLLAFVRDPAQWGQVILLLGVGILYLVNANALGEGLRQLGGFSTVVLVGVHTGIVSFIAGGLAARFAFPQVGLEGPAIWLIDGAPIPPRRLLQAKWFAAGPVVVIYPVLLGFVGGWTLDFGFARTLWSGALIALVATSVAGLGVARGGLRPLFDASSLSELAMGPGAISTVLQATLLSGLASVAAFVVGGLGYGAQRGYVGGITATLGQVGGLLVVVAVVIISLRRAFAASVRALLERREGGGGDEGGDRSSGGGPESGAGFDALA